MRIGQTSFIVFVSKLVANALGFLGTVYFARELGASVLGYYAVILALVSWLGLAANIGFSQAITKRLSEGVEKSAYFTAGTIIVTGLGIVLSIFVLVFRDLVNSYVGVQAAVFVICLLFVSISKGIVDSTLSGEHLVHISGILTTLRIGGRSLIQIVLVFGGFGLVGMIGGYAIGTMLAALVGFVFISVRFTRPRKRHFRELYNYAKFSWLGSLESRTFNDVDILVLGALVPSSLVGIYSVAWSIAKFLSLFSDSIYSTLFPELSFADAEGRNTLVTDLVTKSIAYGGLIAIPGLFGGIILGDQLLLVYDEEFVRGAVVLPLLILATLVYGYQKLLMNAMNALDRPDLSFRVNGIFIATNVALNVMLVLWIGWVGAAIATVVSAVVGVLLSSWMLGQIVDYAIPLGQIGRQLVAAVLMSIVVYGIKYVLEFTPLTDHNTVFVVLLVILGAGVYFLSLLSISREFRTTVVANSPVTIPFLS
ncbi:flippase [Halorubrum sp. AD140]|uniref:flippase n=1 Tax=Halorubrum sp. AD140 TaxID=3050073 RepID=UPI002ACD1A52|nr:flippase [Halorubrum sp. AD140]MDZ5810499.1 flippase [Halorubrum sp. AD140]